MIRSSSASTSSTGTPARSASRAANSVRFTVFARSTVSVSIRSSPSNTRRRAFNPFPLGDQRKVRGGAAAVFSGGVIRDSFHGFEDQDVQPLVQ